MVTLSWYCTDLKSAFGGVYLDQFKEEYFTFDVL